MVYQQWNSWSIIKKYIESFWIESAQWKYNYYKLNKPNWNLWEYFHWTELLDFMIIFPLDWFNLWLYFHWVDSIYIYSNRADSIYIMIIFLLVWFDFIINWISTINIIIINWISPIGICANISIRQNYLTLWLYFHWTDSIYDYISIGPIQFMIIFPLSWFNL